MSVEGRITWKNGTEAVIPFRSFLEATAWLEKHFGEYKAASVRQFDVSEMRQGKGGKDEPV